MTKNLLGSLTYFISIFLLSACNSGEPNHPNNIGNISMPSNIKVVSGLDTDITVNLSPTPSTSRKIEFGTSNSSLVFGLSNSCTVPANESECSIKIHASDIESGTAVVTATTDGYLESSTKVNVIGQSEIFMFSDNMQDMSSVIISKGTSTSFYIDLSTPATVDTLLKFTSDNPTVAAVFPGECYIPQNYTSCPTNYFQLYASNVGVAHITATAAGYLPTVSNVNVNSDIALYASPSPVVVNAGATTILTIYASNLTSSTLNLVLSSYQPDKVQVTPYCTVGNGMPPCQATVYGVEPGGSPIITISGENVQTLNVPVTVNSR